MPEDKRTEQGEARVSPKDEPPNPVWQRFLESSGGAALITVLIGGLLGTLVTNMFQEGAKAREFQRDWMQARGNQALVAYKEYLDHEQEIVKRSYELIGSCISVSEDMITMTGTAFDYSRFVGADRARVVRQRERLREDYNNKDAAWRSQHAQLALLMSFYHQGRPEVAAAWDDAGQALTLYMACARSWYLENPTSQPEERLGSACKAEKSSLNERLLQLTQKLEGARQYAWEGWESPEKLRSKLAK